MIMTSQGAKKESVPTQLMIPEQTSSLVILAMKVGPSLTLDTYVALFIFLKRQRGITANKSATAFKRRRIQGSRKFHDSLMIRG